MTDPRDLWRPPVTVLVLGDYGRDAALRFCRLLADYERTHVQEMLGPGRPFYDEYRRLRLLLVGDVRYTKAVCLAPFARAGAPLDERVLAGYPGGVPLDDLVAPFAALTYDALRAHGWEGTAHVAIPCNTLSPVAWALAGAFATPRALRRLLAGAGRRVGRADAALINALTTPGRVSFPTVPEAVWAALPKGSTLLPLGTDGMDQLYRRAAQGQQRGGVVVGPSAAQQRRVRAAIRQSVAGRGAAARRTLRAVVNAVRSAHTAPLHVVEACTDLGTGLGIDSNERYAAWLVAAVYGAEVPRVA